jgi:hypothetical protein
VIDRIDPARRRTRRIFLDARKFNSRVRWPALYSGDAFSAEFGIPENRIATISELLPGSTFIEDLLDEDALEFIQKELQIAQHPSKSQIRRFVQERLASNNIHKLSSGFASRAATMLGALNSRLA